MSLFEIVLGTALEALFLAFGVGAIYWLLSLFSANPKRHVIHSYQRGVMTRGKKVVKVLEPGAHWILPGRLLLVCDVRPTPFQLDAIELPASDGRSVRVQIGGEYRVTDPARFVTESSDAFSTFYLEAKQATRTSVSELNSENLLRNQTLLLERVRELLIPKTSQLGLEIRQLEIYDLAPAGWSVPR